MKSPTIRTPVHVADLSPAILDRTLFHATSSYFIPNVKATGISCKTNLAPNTAFRGFGGPQAKFVIEAAIRRAAKKSGIDVEVIQRKNLLRNDEKFYYGQVVKNSQAENCWDKADKLFQFEKVKKEVEDFNERNSQFKKGFALMPICFGISFTNSFLNQASALVHIYTDGSVGVSTAAIEMGQGVNEKIKLVVAKVLSINPERIKIETTNTTRIANTSPTAASSGADLNGNAALLASNSLLERLIKVAADELKIPDQSKIKILNEHVFVDEEKSDLVWNDLIKLAYFKRISLSSHAYYATPEIYFDKTTNTGSPFAYHVYGTGISVVTLDCLRGTYIVDSVKVVHDFGKSINPVIDRGQVEGGIVQGIGWLTIEEISHSEEGKLLSNSLSTYKVPDIYSAPKEIEVEFLEDAENKFGPFNSKAIGEPPFMYAIGTYFAILNAMKAFQTEKEFSINAPLTPEKVLLALHSEVGICMKEIQLWNFLLNTLNSGKKAVLLVVAESSNSSPGRQGFKMVITEDAEQFGTIGGGIMEKDMIEYTLDLLFGNESKLIKKLHHSDKTNFEKSGLICGGYQTIIFSVIDKSQTTLIENILSSISEKQNNELIISPKEY